MTSYTFEKLLGKAPHPRSLPYGYEPPLMNIAVYLEICEDTDPWATCRSWLTTVDPKHGAAAVAELERSTPREARHLLHHLIFTATPMRVITTALRHEYDPERLLAEWCLYQQPPAAEFVTGVESDEPDGG